MTTTIDDVFTRFLQDQRERLSARTYQQYEQVIELFAVSMNGYAANHLSRDEFAQWEERMDAGDELAFTGMFGPDKIAENLAEFLDYFMVSKVAASQELLKAAGTVTKKLAGWLADNGHVTGAAAEVMTEQGVSAAVDLPAVDALADALYRECERLPRFDPDSLDDDSWVDDYLTIIKVEPGRIWFDGLQQPLAVAKTVSAAARQGWTVNVEMVKLGDEWRLVEVGNVYP